MKKILQRFKFDKWRYYSDHLVNFCCHELSCWYKWQVLSLLHICFSFLHHELPLHMNTSVWVEQAERERKGGLFSNTSIATAFTQNEAYEKGRRPPALPVTLTPDTVPLVSQRAVDAIAVVFGFGCILDLFLFIYLFLARCGVSPVTDMMKSAMESGICWDILRGQHRFKCKAFSQITKERAVVS